MFNCAFQPFRFFLFKEKGSKSTLVEFFFFVTVLANETLEVITMFETIYPGLSGYLRSSAPRPHEHAQHTQHAPKKRLHELDWIRALMASGLQWTDFWCRVNGMCRGFISRML